MDWKINTIYDWYNQRAILCGQFIKYSMSINHIPKLFLNNTSHDSHTTIIIFLSFFSRHTITHLPEMSLDSLSSSYCYLSRGHVPKNFLTIRIHKSPIERIFQTTSRNLSNMITIKYNRNFTHKKIINNIIYKPHSHMIVIYNIVNTYIK